MLDTLQTFICTASLERALSEASCSFHLDFLAGDSRQVKPRYPHEVTVAPKPSRLLQTRPKKQKVEISETFIIKLRSSDPK